ncbi:MAG TPA: SRPBCC family protein [Candidatus Nanoarchaeia archaeon]|nr:SRPBCC family protein [Candidatus Nanoarchaeia archaeon]
MARIERSIEINEPLGKVFSLINWDKVPEYYDSIKKVEWTSEPKMKVGATVHVFSEIAGSKGEWNAEITEYKDNEKVSWRTTEGNMTIIYNATLDPTKAGTKLTTSFDYELPYSILGKLIDKLRVHKSLEKETEKALQKMKAIAEQ